MEMAPSQLALMVIAQTPVLTAPPQPDEALAQTEPNHPVAVLTPCALMGLLWTCRPALPVQVVGQSAVMGPALSVEMEPSQAGQVVEDKEEDNIKDFISWEYSSILSDNQLKMFGNKYGL